MGASESGLFNFAAYTDPGLSLVGGRVYTYVQGTTTLKVAYTEPTGTVAQTYTSDGVGGQYIGLNARGEMPQPLYLAPGSYDISLKRADGSTVWTRRADPIADQLAGLSNQTDPLAGSGLLSLNASLNYTLGTLGAWANERVDASMFPYLASSGSSDNTIAINAACAFVGTRGGGIVTLPAGVFLHASLIKVPAGVVLEGQGDATVLKCTRVIPTDGTIPGAAHQGQSLAATGSNTGFRRFKIDGGGFATGGIVVSGVSNSFHEGIRVGNSATTGGAQAFQWFAASNLRAWDCHVETSLHGFQIWGCTDAKVWGCTTNRTSSGLYTAGATGVEVWGNRFTNCDDVCLDFEGGIDCLAFGNYCSGGKNGEMAFFQDGTGNNVGCTNLVMRGNVVRRTANYINRAGISEAVNTSVDAGALWVSSLSAGTRDCGFFDNDVTVEAGAGALLYVSSGYGTGVQDFHVQDGSYRFEGLGPLFVIAGKANGLKFNEGTWDITQGITTTSTLKNVKGGQFSDHRFNCMSSPSVPLIKLYSDVAAQQTCMVSANEFYGCGDNAMVVDQFNSGYGTFTLRGNRLTDGPTGNGGLVVNTTNEVPKYEDQVIDVAENDTASGTRAFDVGFFTAFASATPAFRPFADIAYVNQIGGSTRTAYKLLMMTGRVASMNGLGSASGVGASTSDYIASISGTVVNLVKTVATPNTSFFRMTLNSVA